MLGKLLSDEEDILQGNAHIAFRASVKNNNIHRSSLPL
jgi:hypothetical protein